MRDAGRGLLAAAAAVLAMTVVAAAGLALLGAGELGPSTAAVVALAVGGTAEVGGVPAAGLPVAVRGSLHVLPLGVSLAGAAVLGWLLRRGGENGLLVRGAAAAVALPAGLGAFALAARGKLSLPDGVATGGCVRSGGSARLPVSGALDAGFSVAAGPAMAGALAGTLAVLGACWAGTRFPARARGPRAEGWPTVLGTRFPTRSLRAVEWLAALGTRFPARATRRRAEGWHTALGTRFAARARGLRAVEWLAVLGTRLPTRTRRLRAEGWPAVLGTRLPTHTRGLRAVGWLGGGLAVLCLTLAWVFGGPAAAGAGLLVLPQLVCGVLLLGLGVPWTVTATGPLPCAPDLPPGGPASWVAAVVLLVCGVAVRSRRPGTPVRRAVASAVRFAPAAGAVLAVVTLLSRVSLDVTVGAFGLSLPVFAVRLAADPLLALVAGLAGGAVAGFAGSLLADGISVSSRVWKR